MHIPSSQIILFLLPLLATTAALSPPRPARRSYSTHEYYVLEHDPTSHFSASLSDVSRTLGVEVVEQVGALDNHWLVRISKADSYGWDRRALEQRSPESDPVLDRYHRMRAALAEPLHSRSTDSMLASSIRGLEKQLPRQRIKRQQPPPPSAPSPSLTDLLNAKINKVASDLQIHDPEFPSQWHIINPKHPGMDLNVTGLWEMGITGRDVISAIVDDGLDYESEDLADNFVC